MSTAVETRRPPSRTVASSPLRRFARHWALQIGVVVLAFAVWFVFMNTANRTFTGYDIYNSLMISTPYFGLVAIPLTLVVITGDVTQIDLARGQKSGLNDARIVLKNVRGIAFQQFLAEDVVRHPLVQKIVSAYEKYDHKID